MRRLLLHCSDRDCEVCDLLRVMWRWCALLWMYVAAFYFVAHFGP